MNAERVLVTGATGFIGRALVRRLVEAGARVTALVMEKPGELRPGVIPEAATAVEADLRYAAGLNRAVESASPTLVVHLAAVGAADPFLPIREALRGNLDTTVNLIQAVAGRCRMLVARTPGEVQCINPYAASKAAAWQVCRMFQRTEGWPIRGVMPFQVYGPGLPERTVLGAALRAARSGETFAMTSGEQRRDWIYLDDVVDGMLAAARAQAVWGNGETLELGTGTGTPVREVVTRMMALAGAGPPLLGRLPQRPGEVPEQIADAARTEQLTGWRARVEIEQGLRRLIGSTESTD